MRVGYMAMPGTSQERFMELVAEALDALPDWVREAMDNVEIFVEDLPPSDQPQLLGLYEGVPLADRGFHYFGVTPDRITLFKIPIEREAGGSEGRLKTVIGRTAAHEVAHHFGIDDDRLREIGAY
jgi:predicted Zn-dependent protease with MMP-like domain